MQKWAWIRKSGTSRITYYRNKTPCEPESDRKAEFLTGTPKELAEKLKELIETEKGKE